MENTEEKRINISLVDSESINNFLKVIKEQDNWKLDRKNSKRIRLIFSFLRYRDKIYNKHEFYYLLFHEKNHSEYFISFSQYEENLADYKIILFVDGKKIDGKSSEIWETTKKMMRKTWAVSFGISRILYKNRSNLWGFGVEIPKFLANVQIIHISGKISNLKIFWQGIYKNSVNIWDNQKPSENFSSLSLIISSVENSVETETRTLERYLEKYDPEFDFFSYKKILFKVENSNKFPAIFRCFYAPCQEINCDLSKYFAISGGVIDDYWKNRKNLTNSENVGDLSIVAIEKKINNLDFDFLLNEMDIERKVYLLKRISSVTSLITKKTLPSVKIHKGLNCFGDWLISSISSFSGKGSIEKRRRKHDLLKNELFEKKINFIEKIEE